jgi:ribosomal protein L40E
MRIKQDNRQQQIATAVEEALGDSEICARCKATMETMADKCTLFPVPCPGFNRIDEVRRPIVARVYGWPEREAS